MAADGSGTSPSEPTRSPRASSSTTTSARSASTTSKARTCIAPTPGQRRRRAERTVRVSREVILAGGVQHPAALDAGSARGKARARHRRPARPSRRRPQPPGPVRGRRRLCDGREVQAARGLLVRRPVPGEAPDKCFRAWQKGKGVYATNGVVIAVIQESGEDVDARPDRLRNPGLLQGLLPGLLEGAHQGAEHLHVGDPQGAHEEHGRRCAPALRRSARPAADQLPLLRRADKQRSDLDAMVAGVKFVRSMMSRVEAVDEERLPGPGSSPTTTSVSSSATRPGATTQRARARSACPMISSPSSTRSSACTARRGCAWWTPRCSRRSRASSS